MLTTGSDRAGRPPAQSLPRDWRRRFGEATNWPLLQRKGGSCPGTSQGSVRGVGSQGVLAAEGRIAPWDPTPRADLTRSRSSAEVSQDLRTPKTGQGTPAASTLTASLPETPGRRPWSLRTSSRLYVGWSPRGDAPGRRRGTRRGLTRGLSGGLRSFPSRTCRCP